jgi:hypothetical protein
MEFPALQRLVRFFVGMSIFGGVMLAIGLGLGIFIGVWALSSGLLAGGAVTVIGGWYGHRKSSRALERLRQQLSNHPRSS